MGEGSTSRVRHILSHSATMTESFRSAESVRLIKFEGDATKISPKARIQSFFGYKLPFDRHDWIVDRNGEPVHYVLDYYSAGPDKAFGVHIDVRPAVDTIENVIDRVKMSALKLKRKYNPQDQDQKSEPNHS
eukprot:m.102769 g.102769  ORF g.102769 m.102769 type:complete len:132 (+) comp13784_c0_seq5:556-951(+)